jgi:branched-chain amino acid transport system ATP-binding protein
MEVARALALEPRLLMLDEPLAGLNQSEAGRFADLIVELNAAGLTIVLVEHNLGEVTRIAHRLVVLHNGALLAEGAPREVMARADVRDAYLGAEAHA